ncbi:MAG: hypothetical protein IIY55_05000 [Blautia sp.]|nr:hypothetical protein [Blautia sp.]
MADNKKNDSKKASAAPLSPEELYEKARKLMDIHSLIVQDSFRAETYQRAAELFRQAGDYKDSGEKAKECLSLSKEAMSAHRENLYRKSVRQLQNARNVEDYDKPISSFKELSGYKDSDTLCQEAVSRQEALESTMLNHRKNIIAVLLTAVAALAVFFLSPAWTAFTQGASRSAASSAAAVDSSAASSTESYVSFQDSQPGDEVSFGSFQWLVLDKNERQVRLLLLHAEKSADLRGRPYNDFQKDVTWETCTLRQWLNSEFLEKYFSENEQKRILEKEITHVDNSSYGIDGGSDTVDKVTLLKPEDLTRYAGTISRIRMNCWLMCPGNQPDTAAYMSARNSFMEYGYPVSGTDFYVCPVIVVTIK